MINEDTALELSRLERGAIAFVERRMKDRQLGEIWRDLETVLVHYQTTKVNAG